MNYSNIQQQYMTQYLNQSNYFQGNMPGIVISPFFQFFDFGQHVESSGNLFNSRQFQQIAIQTDPMPYDNKVYAQAQQEQEEREQIKSGDFPIPDKNILFRIFNNPSTKSKDVKRQIQELQGKNTKTLNSFYKAIGQKMIKFKKTKEEIIKFLIRRAWKKQKGGANQAREKYYSEYKSMNSAYLANIFSEDSFVIAFEQMLKNFDNDFDSFNQERFNRFYDYLLSCYVKNNLSEFKGSKECRSKLPYPHWWKQEILQIANGLYDNYCRKGSETKFSEDFGRKQLEHSTWERCFIQARELSQ